MHKNHQGAGKTMVPHAVSGGASKHKCAAPHRRKRGNTTKKPFVKKTGKTLKNAALSSIYGQSKPIRSSGKEKHTSKRKSNRRKIGVGDVIAEYQGPDAIENLKAKHNQEVLKLLEAEHQREIVRESLLEKESDPEVQEKMQEKFDGERRAASQGIADLKKTHEAQIAQMRAEKS